MSAARASMADQDIGTISSTPSTLDPTQMCQRCKEKEASNQISATRTSSQPGPQLGNPSDSKLPPERRASIDAKYESLRLKSKTNQREAYERLELKNPTLDKGSWRYFRITWSAVRRANKIDKKHANEIDRAEKKARLIDAKLSTENPSGLEKVAQEKNSRLQLVKDAIKNFASVRSVSNQDFSTRDHESTLTHPVAAPVLIPKGIELADEGISSGRHGDGAADSSDGFSSGKAHGALSVASF